MPARSASSSSRSRGRASHSREEILRTTIEILDRDGARGLTLRGLASELGGGLGSVYWYVRGKDELLELVCDDLVGEAMAVVEAEVEAGQHAASEVAPEVRALADTDDPAVLEPLSMLRRQALALFEQTQVHPWLAHQLHVMGAGGAHALRFWDRLGGRLALLGLSVREQFHGSTAIIGYVTGVAAEMMAQDLHADPTRSKEEQLDEIAAGWLARDAGELPWIHSIAEEFRLHDDADQFVAGLDLLLGGLVRQALARRRG